MYETGTASAEICPACNGAKVQMNKDGIKVLCPVCGGKGYWYGGYSGPIFVSVSGSSTGTGKDDYVAMNTNKYIIK